MKPFESLHLQSLKELHSPENQTLFEKIFAAIEPHSENIVAHFYRNLLNNPIAIKFLNHDIVKNHLRITLRQWLCDTLTHQNTEDKQKRYYQFQHEIGHIHARIDLPMNLVNYGMSLIKAQVLLTLKNSTIAHDELVDAVILADQLLDWALWIIEESYEWDKIINEKKTQSLKMHMSGQNVAFDYER